MNWFRKKQEELKEISRLLFKKQQEEDKVNMLQGKVEEDVTESVLSLKKINQIISDGEQVYIYPKNKEDRFEVSTTAFIQDYLHLTSKDIGNLYINLLVIASCNESLRENINELYQFVAKNTPKKVTSIKDTGVQLAVLIHLSQHSIDILLNLLDRLREKETYAVLKSKNWKHRFMNSFLHFCNSRSRVGIKSLYVVTEPKTYDKIIRKDGIYSHPHVSVVSGFSGGKCYITLDEDINNKIDTVHLYGGGDDAFKRFIEVYKSDNISIDDQDLLNYYREEFAMDLDIDPKEIKLLLTGETPYYLLHCNTVDLYKCIQLIRLYFDPVLRPLTWLYDSSSKNARIDYNLKKILGDNGIFLLPDVNRDKFLNILNPIIKKDIHNASSLYEVMLDEKQIIKAINESIIMGRFIEYKDDKLIIELLGDGIPMLNSYITIDINNGNIEIAPTESRKNNYELWSRYL